MAAILTYSAATLFMIATPTSTEATAEARHSIGETAACAAMRVREAESVASVERDVQLLAGMLVLSAESPGAATHEASLPVDSRASAEDIRAEEDTRAAAGMVEAADTANWVCA